MSIIENSAVTVPANVKPACPESSCPTYYQPATYVRIRHSLPTGWRRSMSCLLLFAAYCGFLFFYGLRAGELYRTESLRAIIAEEFLRSGNWIVPTLYGQPWLTKPSGMYAAIALVSWPFGGVTEWSARLPSALAATVTVLLFGLYFRRQLGSAGGWLAALLLPMSLMWLDKATAAEIDMLQVFWVTAAILCFLRALEDEKNWFWWLMALLCVAGGVLTKWTAPAFFYGTVIPLLWLHGRLRLLWCRQHLVSALLGAGVCVAWVMALACQVSWEAFYITVSREALMRLSPLHHHRAYPWLETLTHPLRVFGAAMPVSLFALFALRKGFLRDLDTRERRLVQAMHCWIWPNLIFWSLAPQHSIRNSFPLYPGVVGLAVVVWMQWLKAPRFLPSPLGGEGSGVRGECVQTLTPHPCPSPPRGEGRIRWLLTGLILVWFAAKLGYVHGVVPFRDRNRHPRATAEKIAAVVPANDTLYLSQLKDEGIMFYYGRTVRRVWTPDLLPSSDRPLYCILQEAEWKTWNHARSAEAVLHLKDEQGAPLVLIKAAARPAE